MEKKGLEKGRRVLTALLVVTLAVIWGHSMLSAEDSGAESGWVLTLLNRLLERLGIAFRPTEYFVRKAAHFSEYALLGLELGLLHLPPFFTLRGWRALFRRLAKPPVLALLAAFVDETIQLFTPGRGGRIQDMWIDLSGAVCGTAVALAVLALLERYGTGTGGGET